MTDHATHLLYRRFFIVAMALVVLGIGAGQLIQATHRDHASITIHDRTKEWQQSRPCGDKLCELAEVAPHRA